MADAGKAHNLIVGNLLRSLGNRLETRNCNVYPSNTRVKIERLNKYTYPDVSVTCGEELYEGEREDILLNPILSVEVLSPSTLDYDHGDKFQHYQFIKSSNHCKSTF